VSLTLSTSPAVSLVVENGDTIWTDGEKGEQQTFSVSRSAITLLDGLHLKRSMLNRCLLLLGTLTRHQCRRRSRHWWVNLHSYFLKQLIGKRAYVETIRTLTENGLLEVNGRYFVGHYSKSYRVRPCYLLDLTSIRVKCRAHAVYAPSLELQPALARVSLSPDGIALYNARLALCRKQVPPGQCERVESWRGSCLRESVESILARRWWVSRDEKTGRVFSNVSSLPSFLRPHLLVDSVETVEIDIVNSQPYFLAALYPQPCAERTRFVALVGAGGFYEALNAGLSAPEPERKKLKRRVFREILFGRLEYKRELWTAFAAQFPELATLVSSLKWDAGHNALALALQSLEARAIVDGVMAECFAAGVPVLTVHDSVVCKWNDEARVRESILRHCSAVVGAVPTLKVAA
jgi:hypothetical protein